MKSSQTESREARCSNVRPSPSAGGGEEFVVVAIRTFRLRSGARSRQTTSAPPPQQLHVVTAALETEEEEASDEKREEEETTALRPGAAAESGVQRPQVEPAQEHLERDDHPEERVDHVGRGARVPGEHRQEVGLRVRGPRAGRRPVRRRRRLLLPLRRLALPATSCWVAAALLPLLVARRAASEELEDALLEPLLRLLLLDISLRIRRLACGSARTCTVVPPSARRSPPPTPRASAAASAAAASAAAAAAAAARCVPRNRSPAEPPTPFLSSRSSEIRGKEGKAEVKRGGRGRRGPALAVAAAVERRGREAPADRSAGAAAAAAECRRRRLRPREGAAPAAAPTPPPLLLVLRGGDRPRRRSLSEDPGLDEPLRGASPRPLLCVAAALSAPLLSPPFEAVASLERQAERRRSGEGRGRSDLFLASGRRSSPPSCLLAGASPSSSSQTAPRAAAPRGGGGGGSAAVAVAVRPRLGLLLRPAPPSLSRSTFPPRRRSHPSRIARAAGAAAVDAAA